MCTELARLQQDEVLAIRRLSTAEGILNEYIQALVREIRAANGRNSERAFSELGRTGRWPVRLYRRTGQSIAVKTLLTLSGTDATLGNLCDGVLLTVRYPQNTEPNKVCGFGLRPLGPIGSPSFFRGVRDPLGVARIQLALNLGRRTLPRGTVPSAALGPPPLRGGQRGS